MNKEQLAIDIVYAQDKDLDLTPEYWEKKISTLLKRQRREIIEQIKNGEICLNCGRPKKNNLSDWCSDCLENE